MIVSLFKMLKDIKVIKIININVNKIFNYIIKKIKNYSLPLKLTMLFNLNIKVSIVAINFHKVLIFFNSTNIISKFSYCPYFFFYIK
jgi:hypothetical protein